MPDSNDSDYEDDDESPDMHGQGDNNPFGQGVQEQRSRPNNAAAGSNRLTFGGSQRASVLHQEKTLQAMASEDYLVQGDINFDEDPT